jgi:hypothetical protein
MSDPIAWLEQNEGPVLAAPAKLTWERGPKNPDSGAADSYVIEGMNFANNSQAPEGMENVLRILFQSGVTTEVGLNGVTPEILLEVLIDRFEGYQSGPFACEENDRAIKGMRDAIQAIQDRRAERAARGVLNTMKQ